MAEPDDQTGLDALLTALERAARLLADDRSTADGLAAASDRDLLRLSEALYGLLSRLDDSVSNPVLDALTATGGGPIAAASARVARAYGARSAAFSAGGSSAANIGLAAALAPGAVLVDRGAHLSLYGAVGFAGLDVGYLLRDYDRDAGVQLPVTAAEVEAGFARLPHAKAVWITSPTYDGFCADIAAIRSTASRHGARLVVDAAHAAVHGLVASPRFPQAAIRQGADAAVVSLHKKGFGLSQASVALFNNAELAGRYEHFAHLGLQTTSPFHLLIGLADDRVAWGATLAGEAAWTAAAEASDRLRSALARLPGCRPLAAAELRTGMAGDPCHVVVNVRATGRTGYDIQNHLAAMAIDIEMATPETIAIFLGPDNAAHIDRLASAIAAIVSEGVGTRPPPALPAPPAFLPQPVLRPGRAMLGPVEMVTVANAIGRVAAQVVGAYPPGQAIIAPGEVVTAEAIDYLRAILAAGGKLKGHADDSFARLLVVAD